MRIALLSIAMLASLPRLQIDDSVFVVDDDMRRSGMLGRRLCDVQFRPLVERRA